MPSPTPAIDTSIQIERPAPRRLCLQLRGKWCLKDSLETHLQKVQAQFSDAQHLEFNTDLLEEWDSGLLILLRTLIASAQERNIKVDLAGLPSGVQRLLLLSSMSPSRTDAAPPPPQGGALPQTGVVALSAWRDIVGIFTFIGECALSTGRAISGRAKLNSQDLWLLMQECGPAALPIVTLVSFLVGTIIAYMGAVQLQQFGAQIFIADLVAISMAREMGAIMTGVVIAGRSGAAFAAQLGTMQVNEEIDAFRTLGISPIDYLVLPRMLALIFMVPLLTLYADAIGILGGMVVAVTLMDLHAHQYFYQTVEALDVNDFLAGFIKAGAYGVLIAIAGCMRGMQCGRSAQAVGEATTSAVVTSIVFMVVTAAVLAVVYHQVGL